VEAVCKKLEVSERRACTASDSRGPYNITAGSSGVRMRCWLRSCGASRRAPRRLQHGDGAVAPAGMEISVKRVQRL
jgi:hypothetical protein